MLSERERRPFQAFIAFGIVGVSAVLAHTCVFMVLTGAARMPGWAANVLAYATALVISYFGQSRWTFAERKTRSVQKFLFIAATTLAFSSGCAWLLVDRLGFSPFWMLPVILIVIPSMSFLMMRRWAFTSERRRGSLR